MMSRVNASRGYEGVNAVGAAANATPALARGEGQVRSPADRVTLSDEALRLLARDPGPAPVESRREGGAPPSETVTMTSDPVRQLDSSRSAGETRSTVETDSAGVP